MANRQNAIATKKQRVARFKKSKIMVARANNVIEGGRSRSQGEKNLDRAFIWLTLLFAISIAAVLIGIGLTVGSQAIPAIKEFGLGFLFKSAWNPVEDEYGALPMIYGTLVSAAIALLFAIPLGLGTAIFLSEDFLPLPVRTTLTFLVELLAAIPSVVYGLWGIFVLIPFLRGIGTFLHDNFGWAGNATCRCHTSYYDFTDYYSHFPRFSSQFTPRITTGIYRFGSDSLGDNFPGLDAGSFLRYCWWDYARTG